jgi:hypothetical protein
MRSRRIAVAAGALAVVGLLGACGTYRAERNGKDFGDAVCDVKSASADDVQNKIDKAQREMNDLSRIVGRPINEDVSDIQNNLNDLKTHVSQGDSKLAEQDIAVIQRNLAAVGRTLSGKGKAAYDGIQEGLADCDYD